MKRIIILFTVSFLNFCYSVDSSKQFIIEWSEYRTYMIQNGSAMNYRIATYSLKTKSLQVFYQGNIIMETPDVIEISGNGAVIWGPEAKTWRADSFIFEKTKETGVAQDGVGEKFKITVINKADIGYLAIFTSMQDGLPSGSF